MSDYSLTIWIQTALGCVNFSSKNVSKHFIQPDRALIRDQRNNSTQVQLTMSKFIEVTNRYMDEGLLTGA